MKVIPFQSPYKLSAEAREEIAEELRVVIENVLAGDVDGIVCCMSFGSQGTGAFRAGRQTLELIGRMEYMKLSVLAELE